MARRILRLESIGTISTIYKNVPKNVVVEGSPLGLMDYFADCEPKTGNPTLLGLSVSSSFKNAAAGSNLTLSIRWHPPISRPYSAMEMPRFALIGEVEKINPDDGMRIAECYAKYHPDSVLWMPGNKIHESFWMRLVVKEVYWLGGFGDRAYIGFIPIDVWKNISQKEISEVRLPGEEGSAFESSFDKLQL
jgi:hypothetical protein